MSVPMKKSDPAYWMLEEGLSGKRKVKKPEVYNEDCYICQDPEFALMGLPLCYPCYKCGVHVPADDIICDNGHNQDEQFENLEESEESSGDSDVIREPKEKLLGDKIMEDVIREKKDELDDLMDAWGFPK